MRLVRHILEGIGGMEIFPTIGMLIFMVFFVGVVIWVLRINPEKVKTYSRLPFQDKDQEPADNIKGN